MELNLELAIEKCLVRVIEDFYQVTDLHRKFIVLWLASKILNAPLLSCQNQTPGNLKPLPPDSNSATNETQTQAFDMLTNATGPNDELMTDCIELQCA
jgi:hypothetical protein